MLGCQSYTWNKYPEHILKMELAIQSKHQKSTEDISENDTSNIMISFLTINLAKHVYWQRLAATVYTTARVALIFIYGVVTYILCTSPIMVKCCLNPFVN